MAAFTTIDSSADITHVDVLNELVGGISERAQALGQSAWTLVSAGDDIQDKDFWYDLQEWIETYCTSFVDHTQGPDPGDFEGETALPMFTLSSFRSIAGLHSSGFRRATAWDPDTDDWTDLSDAMFSYGRMQAGDIIGPWIWVDLQNALTALKWTTTSPALGGSTLQARSSGYSGWYPTCTDATDEEDTDWSASSWGAGSYYFYVAAGQLEQSGSNYRAIGTRQKSLPAGTIDDVVPCAIDVYFGVDSSGGAYTFDDIDGLGAQEGKLVFHETWSAVTPAQASRGGAGEASWFGAYDTNPLTDAGISCPTPEYRAVYASTMHWLCKWSFSHPG